MRGTGEFAALQSGGRGSADWNDVGLSRMGYIIALVILVIVVPLLFLMLSRRSTAAGGIRSRDHGVTQEEPSSDQPTPGARGALNQPRAGSENRLPPG